MCILKWNFRQAHSKMLRQCRFIQLKPRAFEILFKWRRFICIRSLNLKWFYSFWITTNYCILQLVALRIKILNSDTIVQCIRMSLILPARPHNTTHINWCIFMRNEANFGVKFGKRERTVTSNGVLHITLYSEHIC